MTAASPAAPPPVGENGVNHAMNMPRFHPIAINPNNQPQTSSAQHPPPYRSFGEQQHGLAAPAATLPPPPPYHAPSTLLPQQQQQQQQLPPPHHAHAHAHAHQHPHQHQHQHLQHPAHSGPPPLQQGHQPMPLQLDHIEARLRQIEHEESNRSAARAHLLSVRKREDEEFRMITERAEAEEEELRRRKKRIKRESMGLTVDGQMESPPQPPSRRLSETSAATTLAFFKQQSPPEPRQPEMRPPPPTTIIQQQQPQQQQQQQPSQQQQQQQQPPPPAPMATTAARAGPMLSMNMSMNGPGPFRKKQKYTIKNAEAWGERHGRPATRDPAGRALWKRPSDGQLVYLDCPSPDCGKSDFLTLHGFMCHLTKKHKDRSMGSQSRALDLCGTVYDPNAPRAQRPGMKRGSTEGSAAGSMHTEEPEDDFSSGSDDEHGSRSQSQLRQQQQQQQQQPQPEVKKEDLSAISPPEIAINGIVSAPPPSDSPQQSSSSNKASIASMIDSNVRAESWRPSEPAPSVKEEPAPEPASSEVRD
ncbi:uncharacterized protein TRUGW13939_01897 [Talaromyces rugulosus]|uniref:Uncharacterized protein n=1 Tax=Talaromyces rugulosus TaxID=121627 RepID=A0A7H8QLS3_TALRU|nr:uncharacterized protein TRUGW13939_01897 [Talaromyces rugulosus]QKX54808.1 hypothetical protein TRUGW13939_01897 [Talaromyces rugulosus]